MSERIRLTPKQIAAINKKPVKLLIAQILMPLWIIPVVIIGVIIGVIVTLWKREGL